MSTKLCMFLNDFEEATAAEALEYASVLLEDFYANYCDDNNWSHSVGVLFQDGDVAINKLDAGNWLDWLMFEEDGKTLTRPESRWDKALTHAADVLLYQLELVLPLANRQGGGIICDGPHTGSLSRGDILAEIGKIWPKIARTCLDEAEKIDVSTNRPPWIRHLYKATQLAYLFDQSLTDSYPPFLPFFVHPHEWSHFSLLTDSKPAEGTKRGIYFVDIHV